MAGTLWDPLGEARAALQVVVSDPQYGVAALSNSRVMSNLLHDLLPDSPREARVLVASAETGLAGILQDYLEQGLELGTASALAVASFAEGTGLGPDACDWVVHELAAVVGFEVGGASRGGVVTAGRPTRARRREEPTARVGAVETPRTEALPAEIARAVASTDASVRLAAVGSLTALARSARSGFAVTVRSALQAMTADDSRLVSGAALAALADLPALSEGSGLEARTGPVPRRRAEPAVPETDARADDASPRIVNRGWHMTAYLLPLLGVYVGFFALFLLLFKRDRLIRMNVIQSLLIFLAFGAPAIAFFIFAHAAEKATATAAAVFLWVLGGVSVLIYVATQVYCAVKIGRREQPQIGVLARIARRLAYGGSQP